MSEAKVVVINPRNDWMGVGLVTKETKDYLWVSVSGNAETKFSKRTKRESGKKDWNAVVYEFAEWTPELQNRIDSMNKRNAALHKVRTFLDSLFNEEELLRLHDLLPEEVYSLGRH